MNENHQEIVEQLIEIAWILDHKEWDRLGEIFTEDAEGYGQKGLPAITANTIRYLGRCGPTQHLTGNYRVRVDGDRATSTSYIRAIHFSAPGRPVQHWDFVGIYDDRWLRTDAGWRITHRSCQPLGTLGDLVLPVEESA
ncbi:nuclear transport factor 2 family protein [Rhodococcus sp. BP22]|uniref:nuclear transport factor 2 family protein n=1 Tax=Rhodococcus sp. BP22 TaxID=2758566 RepID=UPI001647B69F|nr:nuclear transport factor 2 family protein [Rhodococcus sp. BP22]